ncbi:MAG: FtsX-like permease family protein, partial [Thermoanaerobaculia bacterium]
PWQPGTTTVLLQTAHEPEAAVPALLSATAQVDPHLPLYRVEPLKAYLADSFALERFLTTLFLCQSALALVLVGAGLHALLSFTTARRSREFALRITLGAEAADLRRLVYIQSLRLIAAGLIAGLALALFLGRSLSGLLFGVAAADAPTLALVAVLLAGIGVLAPRGPLKRALATNPTESLRSD